jgi:multidrug efflux pump subunit AcrA (membrane-fusion protein)
MEGHQKNHRQFQSGHVPTTAPTTAFSSNDSDLPHTPPPSMARWPLGPGPIKPPVLIMPDASAKRRSPPSLRPRSGLQTTRKAARKTTRSRLLWTMTSIVVVLSVMVGVTWIDTKAVADVMFFQVNVPHTTPVAVGNGIVFPLQRFDLSYSTNEQVLEILVKVGDVVQPDQALVRLAHHGLLTSPLRGTVTAININPNEIFSANMRLLTIMDETAAIVHTNLPLVMFGRITSGLAAEVSSPALPGQTFEGTVSSVVPQADTQTDTFEAWVRIDNQKEVLLPGMKVSVRIAVAQSMRLFHAGGEA